MDASNNNLMVELCVEELPPKALQQLGAAFADALFTRLQALGLCTEGSVLRSFASPRRLAGHITAVRSVGPAQTLEQRLMPVGVGYKDAAPTPALLKKMHSLGLAVAALDQLHRVHDGKVEVLVYRSQKPGLMLHAALQQALQEAIDGLPIPKVMSYQLEPAAGWCSAALNTVNFVRPAHAVLALHGSSVVPVEVLGLPADRWTLGHRFESAQQPLGIAHADAWEPTLEAAGAVIPHFAKRRSLLLAQLAQQAAAAGTGLRPVDDAALVDEVTALVERPNVLRCSFEPEYLQLPQECLILTMKAHQKYFPLLDAAGQLTQHFLVVSNLSPADTSAIVQGNERVVRARLADARFFFEQDRQKKLAERLPGLDKVVYHHQLGSQAQRSERVRQLCHLIVQNWRDHTVPFDASVRHSMDVLANKADEAARLAKADLLSGMVGEFPQLQGIMGAHYARLEGLRAGVALAIADHYRPRFAGDDLPRNRTGLVLALADKLETLIGMFGIGNVPTGERDPYALRRHALGVVRMLLNPAVPLDLPHIIQSGAAVFGGLITQPQHIATTLPDFMRERLAGWLRDQGHDAAVVAAVLALRPAQLHDINARLDALHGFKSLPQAADLIAANKRIQNILRKNAAALAAAPVSAQLEQLVAPAEKALLTQMRALRAAAEYAVSSSQFSAQLQSAVSLTPGITAFFAQVMVMVEDCNLRRQRLALLQELRWHMEQVGDMACLAASADTAQD